MQTDRIYYNQCNKAIKHKRAKTKKMRAFVAPSKAIAAKTKQTAYNRTKQSKGQNRASYIT